MSVSVENKPNDDDWNVDGSDDEKYDPSKSGKGIWEPSAEDILKLFDRLEKDKVLELKWKCPGRKLPKSEEDSVNKDVEMEEKQETSIEEEKKPEQPTEFDFDDDEFNDMTSPITPRRTPGSKTPKSQKKVATMDNILKHIMIERKQVAMQKEARKLARSPRTPQSGPRPALGTPPIASIGQGQGQMPSTPVRPPMTLKTNTTNNSPHEQSSTTDASHVSDSSKTEDKVS